MGSNKNKWSDEEDAELLKLVEKGLGYPEIAEVLFRVEGWQ